jgi:hypothetical protein
MEAVRAHRHQRGAGVSQVRPRTRRKCSGGRRDRARQRTRACGANGVSTCPSLESVPNQTRDATRSAAVAGEGRFTHWGSV